MNPTNGKGSNKRKENEQQVQANLEQVKWNVRDKSKDTFKVTIKGVRDDE